MQGPLQDEVAPDQPGATITVARRDYDDLLITYSFLRWMMIGLPFLLFVVTAWYARETGGFESSISAYYGGPMRDVFVAVIIATAACMVTYRGWFAVEDFALNSAGFFAVFVALVPAELDTIMRDLRSREAALAVALRSDGDLPDELPTALRDAEPALTAEGYGLSLRITLTVVLLFCAVLLIRELIKSRRTVNLLVRGGRGKRVIVLCTAAAVIFFVTLAYSQLLSVAVDRVTLPGLSLNSFRFDVHTIAAIFMIASLIVVVFSHGWPNIAAEGDPERTVQAADRTLRHFYKILAGLMSVGSIAVFLLASKYDAEHRVLILEWYEIVLFCCFWSLETIRWIKYLRGAESTTPTTT